MPRTAKTDRRKANTVTGLPWNHPDYMKVWKRLNPKKKKQYQEADRRRMRERTYGITDEHFVEMMKEQGDVCAICKKTMEVPCIDHCHDTGMVRGLLCSDCNLGIGKPQRRSVRGAPRLLLSHGS